MMIDEALYRGITRGRSPRTELRLTPRVFGGTDYEIRNLRPALDELIRAHGGSARQTAIALRVPRSTLGGWLRGVTPRRANLDALRRAQRRLRLPRGREAWMRHGHIVLRATVQVSQDIRDRAILITGWPDNPTRPDIERIHGMQGRILDAWLDGDDDVAVQALLRPIRAGMASQASQDVDLLIIGVRAITWHRTRADALAAQR